MQQVSDIQVAKFNKTQYANDWKRLHHNIEQQLYPIFKKALNEQIKPVQDFIKYYGTANLSAHLSVLVSKQPMQDAYLSAYQKAGIRGAAFSYSNIQRIGNRKSYEPNNFETRLRWFKTNEFNSELIETKSIGFFSEQWRKLMGLFYSTSSSTRIAQVTETTREQIQQLLDEANAQGLTTSETATFIEDQLNDPDFNRMRALRIARTESTTAANYGASLGNESSDYLTAKQWIAVMDQNTRPDHVDANGQVVANTDFFIVGGEEAMYPGDIALSAKEVVNCRCTVAYVPLLSETGVPILK